MSTYQHELFLQGPRYLETLDIDSMVSLDIETTGLDPCLSTAQVVQIGAVQGSTVLCGTKTSLGDPTLMALEREADSWGLGVGSMHWVLRYNHYEDSLFRTVGQRLAMEKDSGLVTVVTSTNVSLCSYTGAKLDILQEMGRLSVPASAEYPLCTADMSRLMSISSTLPGETQALEDTQEACSGKVILGQNILGFDVPYIESRWSSLHGPSASASTPVSFFPRGTVFVDSMWIAKVLVVPMLEAMDAIGGPDYYRVVLSDLRNSRGEVRHGLQNLRKAFGCTGGTAHDAVGDCATTIEVMHKMKEAAVALQPLLESNPSAMEDFRTRSFRACVGPAR